MLIPKPIILFCKRKNSRLSISKIKDFKPLQEEDLEPGADVNK